MTESQHITLHVKISWWSESYDFTVLIDSGAAGNFMDETMAK